MATTIEPSPTALPSLMTVIEVARALNISQWQAHRLKRDGVLKAIKIRKSLRFHPSNVAEIQRNGVT